MLHLLVNLAPRARAESSAVQSGERLSLLWCLALVAALPPNCVEPSIGALAKQSPEKRIKPCVAKQKARESESSTAFIVLQTRISAYLCKTQAWKRLVGVYVPNSITRREEVELSLRATSGLLRFVRSLAYLETLCYFEAVVAFLPRARAESSAASSSVSAVCRRTVSAL
ncbi:MAG: hypothetical protein EAZ92_00755 [Candidatus Kapaibacterium sp.]|nr:MAG: hypothetical protein EAZ92_00755 [Candidatus Kapabacteria bacterium]